MVACVCVCARVRCVYWCLRKTEEGTGSLEPELWIVVCCAVVWMLGAEPCSLEEQRVLLATGPPLCPGALMLTPCLSVSLLNIGDWSSILLRTRPSAASWATSIPAVLSRQDRVSLSHTGQPGLGFYSQVELSILLPQPLKSQDHGFCVLNHFSLQR